MTDSDVPPPKKRAGSRKTLNAPNLASLGAERLAELLVDIAEAQPALKRRLRMELAGEVGADDLAAEIGKRFSTIEAARGRIHWRKYKAFVADLELVRRTIAGRLAELSPPRALELTWRLIDLAEPVFARVRDDKGEVAAVFERAVADLAALALKVRPPAIELADRAFAAASADAEDALDGVVAAVLPVLDPLALECLRTRVEAAAKARWPRPIWRRLLRDIADAKGDVDGYIAAMTPAEVASPEGAAEIAGRLVSAGRGEAAMAALQRAAPRDFDPDWEAAVIEVLEATGEAEAAQQHRWKVFEKSLSASALRSYLKVLPDFEDVEAEDRAMARARTFPNAGAALAFLVEWPAPAQVAALILTRSSELAAANPEMLTAAARLVEGRHPLAAALALRAAIEHALRGRTPGVAAEVERWALEAASLEPQITDHQGFGDHAHFVDRMARRR